MDFDPFNPHFNPQKAAAGDPYPFDTATIGLAAVTDGEIAFTPVPRLRKRRNGWTPEAQRAFIAALEQCGSVSHAARSVGMSPRSAYRLLESEGAESFAEAWDQALARGVERLRFDALDRSLNGSWVPVVRRGRVVRHEFRHCNRLAIALLSGRKACVAEQRERAVTRRLHRMKLLARRKHDAEQKSRAAALAAEHQAVLDRIEEERLNPVPDAIARPPRIRSL